MSCENPSLPSASFLVSLAQVPGLVAFIRDGIFIDFHELGLDLFEQAIEQARAHPPRPTKKPKRLRLFSPDDIRRAQHLIKKAAGRVTGIEIVLGNDGVVSLKVSANEEAHTNSRQPGPSPSESDLDMDRELTYWAARHGH